MVNEPANVPAAESRPAGKLVGWLPMTLGVLAVVIGALWTLQGLDVLTDSGMSGASIWAVIGGIAIAAGLILIIVGVRFRTRSKR